MFASLRNQFSNYRTSSLRFDIEKNIIIEAFHHLASISMPLKGHGNEADFLGFLQGWFRIDPLHFLSSSSDCSFQFTAIFVIEKRLSDF
jgi:hypothetical protein